MKKINLIIPALLFFLLTHLNALPQTAPTEIVVIGTVHVPTENFNSDSLLNIFNKIKPDAFFVECDTSYMTQDFQLKEDIKYSFPETRAITKYLHSDDAELRPYDITGRDNFLDDYERRKNESDFFNDINVLSSRGKLNNFAENILNRILAMMNTADEMANSTFTYINGTEGSVKIDTINYYTYTGFVNLIDASPALSRYKDYRINERRYWEIRNKAMLENILSLKKTFEGKKIIVLCGFSHKNFLVNELKKRSSEENIVIKNVLDF